MPFIQTGLKPGGDISREPAMSKPSLLRAIEYGKATGQMLAPLTDCLVIGESLPGGTTTAAGGDEGTGNRRPVKLQHAQKPRVPEGGRSQRPRWTGCIPATRKT